MLSWGTNLYAPVIVDPLWLAIRNRLRHDSVEESLWHRAWPKAASASRVYLEGDQPAGNEDLEERAWGRLVVVPVDPVTAPVFAPGEPTRLDFLLRAEINSRQRTGTYRHNGHLQRILKQAFLRLVNWDGEADMPEVMVAGSVMPVESWRSWPIDDREATGTYQLSQRYQVDVVEAEDAA